MDYSDLGVATSGATLFRSIGGSLGTAALGAIFANRLSEELKSLLPAGVAAKAGSGGEVFAGTSAPALARPRTPGARKPAVKPHKKKKRSAKAAVAATCTLSTQVALSYQLG